MTNIALLQPHQQFYFSADKGTVYIFLKPVRRLNGSIQAVKCLKIGKLLPVYISAKHSVIVINHSKNQPTACESISEVKK